MKNFRNGTRSRGFVLGFLVLIALSSGCGAFQERLGDFAKQQGMKILANQIDKMEMKIEAELAKKGLDIAKLKDASREIAYALSGTNGDPGAVIVALKKGLDASKDRDGDIEGYGVIALFAYMAKQMWWGKKDADRDRKIEYLASNGNAYNNDTAAPPPT